MLDNLAGQPAGLGHVVFLYGLATVLAATAAVAACATRRLPAVAALAAAAGVVWAADGHPALVGGPVGFAINAVHLVVGAAWVGSLGWLLNATVRYRRDHAELRAVAARYARLALPMVVVLGAAGGVSALEVLLSWRSVYASGYGRLLVVKDRPVRAGVAAGGDQPAMGDRPGPTPGAGASGTSRGRSGGSHPGRDRRARQRRPTG